jgi:hypothetical protein
MMRKKGAVRWLLTDRGGPRDALVSCVGMAMGNGGSGETMALMTWPSGMVRMEGETKLRRWAE